MTPDRSVLVQDSWRAIDREGATLVRLAIQHLFEIAPSSRGTVPADALAPTCANVAEIISQLVETLDDPKRFVPLTIAIGRQNAESGVSSRLYSVMGESLMWALQRRFGHAFTRELHLAWLEAFHLASAIMRRAESSRTGEFERLKTGEYVAFQEAMSR